MNHLLWVFRAVPCQYVDLQTYIENNLDFEIKDFIQLTCIMPILLNIYILNALYIYLMQISFVKKKGVF
jgi:hypothetical protein